MNLSKSWVSVPTESLFLRVIEPPDVSESYVSWLNDPEVNKYLEARWIVHTLESVRNQVDLLFRSDRDMLFGIYSGPQSNVHIGNVKLSEIDQKHGTAEIGFLIGRKEFWGQGLATEAISGICEWAFLNLDLKKITAGAYSLNLGSIRALEKVGFEKEIILRDHAQLTLESRCDVYRFGLYRDAKRGE